VQVAECSALLWASAEPSGLLVAGVLPAEGFAARQRQLQLLFDPACLARGRATPCRWSSTSRLVELLDEDVALDETSRAIVSAFSEAVSRLAELRPERRSTLRALESLLTRRLEQASTVSSTG
jgi:hypothetical protein